MLHRLESHLSYSICTRTRGYIFWACNDSA